MFVTALLLVAGLAGHAPTARSPITCILSNGDRLSGELVSVTQSRIRLTHSVLGRVTIKRSAIAVCETQDSVARSKLGTLALEPLPEMPITTVGVLPDYMPAPPDSVARVVSLEKLINPPRPVPLASRALPTYVSHVGWKRALGATYMLSRGNANVSSLGFTGSVARRADRSQIALAAKREFGTQEGEATENFLSATLRYDLALGPNDSAAAARPSFFTEAVFEHDPFAQIGRRAVENTGLSIPLSRNPHNNLALEIGTGVTNEMPTGEQSYTRIGGLLRLAARQLFGSAKSDQQLAIFPDLSGPHGHYRVNSDFNLSAPIAKSLALKLGIADRYDTRPQTNVRNNDITVQSGIGIEF
jgi:putative salt-induced outer membrane protein YdiY